MWVLVRPSENAETEAKVLLHLKQSYPVRVRTDGRRFPLAVELRPEQDPEVVVRLVSMLDPAATFEIRR